MRSQLDCVHDSLPGTGVFDLKTRAISPIRHDVYNYLKYVGQSLTSLTGRYDSFEAEYYGMVRAAFLESSFQARIDSVSMVPSSSARNLTMFDAFAQPQGRPGLIRQNFQVQLRAYPMSST